MYRKSIYVDAHGSVLRTAKNADDALEEINRLPGRHLYFLDDHLFGNPRFAGTLFEGMKGMGGLWQAAGTVQSVLRPGLLEKRRKAGYWRAYREFYRWGSIVRGPEAKIAGASVCNMGLMPPDGRNLGQPGT